MVKHQKCGLKNRDFGGVGGVNHVYDEQWRMLLLISNELERVFSGARYMVSWDRGQLEAEIIEMRECLKYWKRTGILDTFFK